MSSSQPPAREIHKSDAYFYFHRLIAKPEEEAFISVPEWQRSPHPLAANFASFHEQLFTRGPRWITTAEMYLLGQEAAAQVEPALNEVMVLLGERHVAISEGRQPPVVQDKKVTLEAGIDEIAAGLSTDIKFRFADTDDDVPAMLKRIEQLVEIRWRFQRRAHQLADEKAVREGAQEGNTVPSPNGSQ